MVVLLDHLANVELGALDPAGSARLGLLLDVVARALVRQQAGGDVAHELVLAECPQSARIGHLADRAARQLPAGADGAHGIEHLGPHDRNHPLLRLGDHDLPRLHAFLAQRHTLEMDVDAGTA